MSTEQNEQQQVRQNGRKPLILIGGLFILAMAVAVLFFGGELADDTAETAEAISTLPISGGPVNIGDMAIDFTLTNLDGTAVTLSDHLGQPIVINFWASWCGPCRIEMPELQTLHDQYAANGLVILAVNQAETADVAASFFLDEMGLTFANPLLDSEAAAADKYGVRNLPTTLFIDANGQVTAVHRGPALLSQFEDYLAATAPELVQ